MKELKLIALIGLIFMVSCGKPNDPETIKVEESAGYKIITRFVTSAYAQDIVVDDTLAYIAQGEGGLAIVNIADRNNPVLVSNLTEGVRGYSTKIAKKHDAVFLAAGSLGVSVVYVEDPSQPVATTSNLSMKPAKNFHIMGDYLFTAISEHGVAVADISNPIYPDIRGENATSGYARGTTTTSDSTKLLVACGEMGLSILDITDFQEGYGTYPLWGWKDTQGYAEAVAIKDDEIAFLACGTQGLQIIDFSDSANVHIVGSYTGGGYAKEIIYENDLIFMTVENRGLQIINVADETEPILVGSLYSEYALGIDMDDNYIYIADELEGLIIISKP